MDTLKNKPTPLFWIIGCIALIWNIMGIIAYLSQAYMTTEALLSLPIDDQKYYNNLPAWVTANFAIAVFCGTIGSITLLLRKKLAISFFIASLIGVLAQSTYTFFIQNYIKVTAEIMLMPILIIIFAIFLLIYSKKAETKGIIL